jgi:hypothetical protein
MIPRARWTRWVPGPFSPEGPARRKSHSPKTVTPLPVVGALPPQQGDDDQDGERTGTVPGHPPQVY